MPDHSLTLLGDCNQIATDSAAAAGGAAAFADVAAAGGPHLGAAVEAERRVGTAPLLGLDQLHGTDRGPAGAQDRKSTRLNSSHQIISYAVFCLKKKTPITWC